MPSGTQALSDELVIVINAAEATRALLRLIDARECGSTCAQEVLERFRTPPFSLTSFMCSLRQRFIDVSYFTLPALFSKTTFDSIAVSTVAGMCEQKPIPT